jgi:hypothetical protein
MMAEATQRAVEVFNDEDPETSLETTQTETTETTDKEPVQTTEAKEVVKEEQADEVVVQIGEESLTSSEPAPEWVKDLRKTQAELRKRNKELEEQLQATKQSQQPAAVLGKKPTIDDFDYDAEKFEAELIKWHEQKLKVEADAAKKAKEAETEEQAWKEKLTQFEEGKKSLKVRDYDEAEMIVHSTLSVVQQGIIVQGASNPALLTYAIGKSPEKAKQLASISDPVKFAFAVAQLEKDLKVTSKSKAPPPPEELPQGHGSVAAGSDKQLEKLRSEAEKTGDYTKVHAYKRQKRE